ncbi:cytochrome C oxidase subunit IV family protein [Rhizobium sp. Nf11,1]|uniref:cytochrome C oxidase subunit IV family protein n=1 Tax=Rhizobium sp. Nf11,1 TaxID=3404923 RepID=UPI003D3389C9
MTAQNRANAPSRALIFLLMLTSCVFAASMFLSGAAARPALALAAGLIALAKVRLVVSGFLGLRVKGSPVGLALILWAAAVLLPPLASALAFSAVFAN